MLPSNYINPKKIRMALEAKYGAKIAAEVLEQAKNIQLERGAGTKTVDISPLTKEEINQLKELIKEDNWAPMAPAGTAKNSRNLDGRKLFSRLALRFLKNNQKF